MVTKEEIISSLQKAYKEKKSIPRSNDKFPFCTTTVCNKFGTWNNALEESNIPLRINKRVNVMCENCNIEFFKLFKAIQKTSHNFCSKRCAAKYTNTHRKTGNKVSKLELYLQANLLGYTFVYNDRKFCEGLEIDIYIPDLKLAFEINGIFHYKPIYGQDKLDKTQRKDKEKLDICNKKHTKLIVLKDESNKFSIGYGNEILEKIYTCIFKLRFTTVLQELQKNQ